MKEIAPLTRAQALRAIQHHLGTTEETAWMTDWIQDLWETVDEVYTRLQKNSPVK